MPKSCPPTAFAISKRLGLPESVLEKAREQLEDDSIKFEDVLAEIEKTRIIKTSIYDLADGQVQVYVCIEMKTDKDNFIKQLDNTLKQEDIIGIEADRERFIEKAKAGIEEYKQKNSSK